ncbi:hypothetical protein BTM374_04950 [Helicobacter pylori]
MEFIFDCEEKGVKQVALQDIYQALEERIKKEEWGDRYKSDTFRNTIKGELNHHVLKDNPLKDNFGLFERLEKGFLCTNTQRAFVSRTLKVFILDITQSSLIKLFARLKIKN